MKTVVLLWGILLAGLVPRLQAQSDSLPFIFEGEMDWVQFKRNLGAPDFNQKDLVMYLVRQQGLAPFFEDENDQDWVPEFHFVDFDQDRNLDAVYCGYNRGEGQFRTMVFQGDTVLSYPLGLSVPGYLHDFRRRDSSSVLLLREDASDKYPMTRLTAYRLGHDDHAVDTLWEVRMLPGTQMAPTVGLDVFRLREPAELKLTPELDTKEVYDWNRDGRPDAEGNTVAVFAAGTRLIRLFEEETEDGEFSFVIVLDPPSEGRHFGPLARNPVYFGGWVASERFEN